MAKNIRNKPCGIIQNPQGEVKLFSYCPIRNLQPEKISIRDGRTIGE